ncbi:MAG: class I SAM-dependent methyltransferase [Trebonia sp.]
MWNLMNAARELAPVARAFPSHPVRVVRALPDEWRQRMQHTSSVDSDFDDDWLEHLHGLLGAPWPCQEVERLHALLAEVGELLKEKGLGTGLHTYGWYSDADVDMCTAIWCAARHRRPEVVLETGVAHGVSSRVILEALNLNGLGRLWSIDIANPLNRSVHGQEGVAVTDACRPRWTYVEGESRLRMPPLVEEVGRVDLFVHDSLHTLKNTLFEMEQAASVMSTGGVMLVDDIRSHDGFKTFAERHPEFKTILVSTLDGVGGLGIAVL